MLAKKLRLIGEESFDKVHKEGHVYQSDNFGMAVLDRKDEEPSRFAFIVSTKISKDAVDRNRFKRVMSEAVRLSSNILNPGFDVVFLAKTSIVRIPTSDLMKEVVKALKDGKIIK